MKCTVKKVIMYNELRSRKTKELGEATTDSSTEPSNAHVGNPASRHLLGRGPGKENSLKTAAANEMAKLEKNRIKTKRQNGIDYMKKHLPKSVQLCVLGKANKHVHSKRATTRKGSSLLGDSDESTELDSNAHRTTSASQQKLNAGRRGKGFITGITKSWGRRRRKLVLRRRRTKRRKRAAKVGFRDGRYCILVKPEVSQKDGVVWKSSISNTDKELGEGSGLADTLTHQEKLYLAKERVAQQDIDQCLNMQWEKRAREMCIISKAFKMEADSLGAMVV